LYFVQICSVLCWVKLQWAPETNTGWLLSCSQSERGKVWNKIICFIAILTCVLSLTVKDSIWIMIINTIKLKTKGLYKVPTCTCGTQLNLRQGLNWNWMQAIIVDRNLTSDLTVLPLFSCILLLLYSNNVILKCFPFAEFYKVCNCVFIHSTNSSSDGISTKPWWSRNEQHSSHHSWTSCRVVTIKW